jgi:DNA invertase Pin-like site-specific DNA recombinase
MSTAIAAAAEHGEAELWVFHSSRLARGNGRKGRRSINLLVAQLLYEDVIVRSVSDPEFVTPMLAGIGAEVAHKCSADLSTHTLRGLRQRKEAGKPMGPIPLGYKVEVTVDSDRATTSRVIDPETMPTIERIFGMVETGATFGAVARRLNAEGIPSARGRTWVSRTVRGLVFNAAYKGAKGYPPIVDPERYDRIFAGLRRLDPVATQKRNGGRKPSLYAEIVDVVRGLRRNSPVVRQLREGLASVIAAMYAEVTDGRLTVEFELSAHLPEAPRDRDHRRCRVLRLHPRTDGHRTERHRASSSHPLPCDVVLSGDPLPGAP